MDTINRLLRKQAPKRRGKVTAAEIAAEGGSAAAEQPEDQPVHAKPDPIMVRWISSRDGCRVGVPDEWLGTPAGRLFGNGNANRAGKLVEEV